MLLSSPPRRSSPSTKLAAAAISAELAAAALPAEPRRLRPVVLSSSHMLGRSAGRRLTIRCGTATPTPPSPSRVTRDDKIQPWRPRFSSLACSSALPETNKEVGARVAIPPDVWWMKQRHVSGKVIMSPSGSLLANGEVATWVQHAPSYGTNGHRRAPPKSLV